MRRLVLWLLTIATILCAAPAVLIAQAAAAAAPAAPSGPVWNIVIAVAALVGMYLSQVIKKGWTWLDTVAVAKYPIVGLLLPVVTGQVFAAIGNAIGWVPSTTNIGDWNAQIVTGGIVAALSVLWHQLAQSVPWFGQLVNAGTTPSPGSAPAAAPLSKSAP